ncbi:MAG: response regulator [Symploca sp. SIO2C1]|nr:response regulator [Symploca sp. SIO2C1]
MYNKPIHVLLVEDSPSDARLQHHRFSRLDQEKWQLVHVESLTQAINRCRKFTFDVVLLDLNLPDSDGLETVVEFRAVVPNIPVIILTGSDDDELALGAISQGTQDYLCKDKITIPLLVRTIYHAIEREQILKQLRESERRFRGVFNQTFQFMALLTPEGTVLEMNQTAIEFSKVKHEDYVGLPLWDSYAWNYSQTSQNWLKGAINKASHGKLVREEVQIRSTDEDIVWIDFSLKPLTDETGKVVLLIEEGREINARKNSEINTRQQAEAEMIRVWEQEQELNQIKLNFVSMVSHEFRTPLTTIQTSNHLLEQYQEILPEDKRQAYHTSIKKAVYRITNLLDDALIIGKNVSRKIEFEPAPLNLVKFCKNLVAEQRTNISNNCQIVFNHQGKYNNVYLDQNLLRQIIKNVLSNGIKFSLEGATIKFELSSQDEVATFCIQDEGIGIPPEELDRVFEPFYRAGNVGNIQGTGLGLSIVKKAIDLHGGQILLTSKVGVGTTVKLTLPVNAHQLKKKSGS